MGWVAFEIRRRQNVEKNTLTFKVCFTVFQKYF